MNPFIYAIKHEGVREKLAGLMVWREQLRRWLGTAAAVAAQSGSDVVGNVAAGTQQAHT